MSRPLQDILKICPHVRSMSFAISIPLINNFHLRFSRLVKKKHSSAFSLIFLIFCGGLWICCHYPFLHISFSLFFSVGCVSLLLNLLFLLILH